MIIGAPERYWFLPFRTVGESKGSMCGVGTRQAGASRLQTSSHQQHDHVARPSRRPSAGTNTLTNITMLSEIDDLRRELDDLRKRYASLEAEKKELELRFEKEYQKWKRFKKWVLVGGSIKAGTTTATTATPDTSKQSPAAPPISTTLISQTGPASLSGPVISHGVPGCSTGKKENKRMASATVATSLIYAHMVLQHNYRRMLCRTTLSLVVCTELALITDRR